MTPLNNLEQLLAELPWYLELQAIREKDASHAERAVQCLNELAASLVSDKPSDKQTEVELFAMELFSAYPLIGKRYPEIWEQVRLFAENLFKSYPEEFGHAVFVTTEFLRRPPFRFFFPPSYTEDSLFYCYMVKYLDVIQTLNDVSDASPFCFLGPFDEEQMKQVITVSSHYDIKLFLSAWKRHSEVSMDLDVAQLYESMMQ